jgi:glycosyltransferase involved in cell wall biosynthesis
VTGTVPDVRPYIAHAAVAVAPLRIARGIQNKVLEAMAMATPVVVSPQALEGIDAVPGSELVLADGAAAFADACAALLAKGRTAQRRHRPRRARQGPAPVQLVEQPGLHRGEPRMFLKPPPA